MRILLAFLISFVYSERVQNPLRNPKESPLLPDTLSLKIYTLTDEGTLGLPPLRIHKPLLLLPKVLFKASSCFFPSPHSIYCVSSLIFLLKESNLLLQFQMSDIA